LVSVAGRREKTQGSALSSADTYAFVPLRESKLNKQWSPEERVHRLRLDYPADERMRISHETIYHWVYRDASAEGKLYLNLRRKLP
jgi:IS30 family transposase